MDIIARKIDLIGSLPSTDERKGGATFEITFEVNQIGDRIDNLELTFTVTTLDGVQDAVQQGRKKLIALAEQLRATAMTSDLGHGERRLY